MIEERSTGLSSGCLSFKHQETRKVTIEFVRQTQKRLNKPKYRVIYLTFDLKSGKSRRSGRNARILDSKDTNKAEANPVGGLM